MIESNITVEDICTKTGIDEATMVRFLRFNRRNTQKTSNPKFEPEVAKKSLLLGTSGKNATSKPADRKLLRPKSQQGETAVLHAIIVERDIVVPDDSPLEMGLVDSDGRSIPFERVFLLVIVSVFACSLLYFGLKDISSEKETVAPELVSGVPSLMSDLSYTDQAAEVLHDFVGAKTPDDKSACVRRPDIVKPLMKKWYGSHPPGKFQWDEWNGRTFALDGKNFLTVTFFNNNDLTSFDALFEIPESGRPLLDWESFVGYSPLSWDEFRDIRPVDSMKVRVYFEPSELYYPPFDDTEVFAPARLTDPQSTVPLIGYLRKGSSAALILRHLVHSRHSNARYPVILKLRFPQGDNIDPNLVEITDVIQTNWITQYP